MEGGKSNHYGTEMNIKKTCNDRHEKVQNNNIVRQKEGNVKKMINTKNKFALELIIQKQLKNRTDEYITGKPSIW